MAARQSQPAVATIIGAIVTIAAAQGPPVDEAIAYFCPQDSCFTTVQPLQKNDSSGLPVGICVTRSVSGAIESVLTPEVARNPSRETRTAALIEPDAPIGPPPFNALIPSVGPESGYPIASCCNEPINPPRICPAENLTQFENSSFPRGEQMESNLTKNGSCPAIEFWSLRPVRACGFEENLEPFEEPEDDGMSEEMGPTPAQAPAMDEDETSDDGELAPLPRLAFPPPDQAIAKEPLPQGPVLPFALAAEQFCCLANTTECNECRRRCSQPDPPRGCEV